MDQWLKENMHSIMTVIGVASFIGVVAIFAAYFVIKKRLQKQKEMDAE